MRCVEYEFFPTFNNTYCITWKRSEPTAATFLIYAFIVPVLSIFGLCANFINAIVFSRPKMTPSAFSYLCALSWIDCCSCLLITMTAFSRSICHDSIWWLKFDLHWQTPFFGMTTGAANLVLACVSLDRWIYLRHGIPNGTPPRFCRRKIARRLICLVIIFSTALNVPYFFIYVIYENGNFKTTDFYYSKYYKIHNWITFAVLGVLPAIFLLIGNVFIIRAFRRWTKQGAICQKPCNNNKSNTKANEQNTKMIQKRYQHQTKLTTTIVIVITLYLIGELPAHLTSRKSALNLLFGGDQLKVKIDLMEKIEIICMTLNALQLSLNIVVYAVINPYFMPEFFSCLRGASDVCFRILCFTTIANCCERIFCGCGKTQNTAVDAECDSISAVPARRSTTHRRKVVNSWGDEEYSRSSFGLGAGCAAGVGANVEMRHRITTTADIEVHSDLNRSRGDGQSWSENLHVEWVWKQRSSSVGDFTFENTAMSSDDFGSDIHRVEMVENAGSIRKRHSMGV